MHRTNAEDVRTYRIVLEYTDAGGEDSPRDHPSVWNWAKIILEDSDEDVRLISVRELGQEDTDPCA